MICNLKCMNYFFLEFSINIFRPQLTMGDWNLQKVKPRIKDRCCYCLVALVISSSVWPYGLQQARLLCPWDSPGKNTGEGCHALFQGIFLTQGSNPGLPHCRQILYHLNHQEAPMLWKNPNELFGQPNNIGNIYTISKITAGNWVPRVNRWHVNKGFHGPKDLGNINLRNIQQDFYSRHCGSPRSGKSR